MVDGSGQVVFPVQEIFEIQNEHSCRKNNKATGYKPKSGLGNGQHKETRDIPFMP